MNKKVTIYDIAKALQISTATVNRALNNKPEISEKTRALVLDTARKMGFTANSAAKSLARPEIRIAFVVHNQVPEYSDEIIAGVKRAFDELRDFRVTGEIYEFRNDPYAEHQRYMDKLDELAAEKPQGALLLTPSDTRGIYEAIARLTKNGVKVALVNTELPGSGRLFSLRQNAILAGRMAAELLSWFAPTRNVAILTGRRDVSDHADAIGGFLREGAYRKLNVVSIVENHDDPGFASYNTESLFREHPEIEGLYISTATSIPVCQKIIEMGLARKVKIVASDVFTQLIQMMQDDVIQATIFQDPYRQGRQAIKQLYRCIAEGERPKSEIFLSPRAVLQSNLSDFAFLTESEPKA